MPIIYDKSDRPTKLQEWLFVIRWMLISFYLPEIYTYVMDAEPGTVIILFQIVLIAWALIRTDLFVRPN